MKKLAIILALALCSVQMTAQPKLNKDNIDEVLKAMTLEEKATLVVGSGWGSMTAGSMTASDRSLVPGAAGTTQAIPRLGIPNTVLADGPAGLRISPARQGTDNTFYCTAFPVGTAIASSWDVNLVQEMTKAMGKEVLEYGADVLLAPGANLHRNPLCGRNFEYFSEDPYLSGKIAAAYIRGIQSNGVGVSLKHYAVNNQETNRNENDAQVGTRALREIYLKNFEIAVKEANPWTVMSSYNKVNGSYTQQDYDILTSILRNDFGFNGIVMTDWGSKAGTVAAVHAGNDLMEPGSPAETERIIAAVKDGSLSVTDLDRNVRRILEFIVKTPRFKGYKYSDKPDLKAHAAAARAAATASMVLLKNKKNTLPLKDVKTIALFGVSSVDFVAGGTGSGNVNKAYVINMVQGFENAGYEISVNLKDYYQKYVDLVKAESNLSRSNEKFGLSLGNIKIAELTLSRPDVDKQAVSNDIAVIVIGRNSGEGADRKMDNDFNLTNEERQLVNDVCGAFHQANKQVVVVLNIGGVIETYSWKNLPDAILCAWQPGQEGGNAIVDVLTGKVTPSGKLPMTFPLSFMDHPSSVNFPSSYNRSVSSALLSIPLRGPKELQKNVDYTIYAEGIWVGYRFFDKAGFEVSYPFGYGLSYTDFSYSKPVIKANKEGGFTASITVTNTGKVTGKEVVQLYVSAPEGGLIKPVKELKSFAKTRDLKSGESQTVTMHVSTYELASFNSDNGQWETAAGKYSVSFAKNVNCVQTTVPFELKKAEIFSVDNPNACAPENPMESTLTSYYEKH